MSIYNKKIYKILQMIDEWIKTWVNNFLVDYLPRWIRFLWNKNICTVICNIELQTTYIFFGYFHSTQIFWPKKFGAVKVRKKYLVCNSKLQIIIVIFVFFHLSSDTWKKTSNIICKNIFTEVTKNIITPKINEKNLSLQG